MRQHAHSDFSQRVEDSEDADDGYKHNEEFSGSDDDIVEMLSDQPMIDEGPTIDDSLPPQSSNHSDVKGSEEGADDPFPVLSAQEIQNNIPVGNFTYGLQMQSKNYELQVFSEDNINVESYKSDDKKPHQSQNDANNDKATSAYAGPSDFSSKSRDSTRKSSTAFPICETNKMVSSHAEEESFGEELLEDLPRKKIWVITEEDIKQLDENEDIMKLKIQEDILKREYEYHLGNQQRRQEVEKEMKKLKLEIKWKRIVAVTVGRQYWDLQGIETRVGILFSLNSDVMDVPKKDNSDKREVQENKKDDQQTRKEKKRRQKHKISDLKDELAIRRAIDDLRNFQKQEKQGRRTVIITHKKKMSGIGGSHKVQEEHAEKRRRPESDFKAQRHTATKRPYRPTSGIHEKKAAGKTTKPMQEHIKKNCDENQRQNTNITGRKLKNTKKRSACKKTQRDIPISRKAAERRSMKEREEEEAQGKNLKSMKNSGAKECEVKRIKSGTKKALSKSKKSEHQAKNGNSLQATMQYGIYIYTL